VKDASISLLELIQPCPERNATKRRVHLFFYSFLKCARKQRWYAMQINECPSQVNFFIT